MADLNDFIPVDYVHYVTADWVASLIAASFRSEYKNVETLSATRTLADSDTSIQRLNCNGANRIVKMPTANAVDNHPYFIVNSTSSGSWTLAVQSNDGGTTLITLDPEQSAMCVPDGDGEYKLVGSSSYPFSTVVSPSQITSNQNNYSPTGMSTAQILRISTDAYREITGLATGAANRVILITNVGTYPVALKKENASSTAANRFAFKKQQVLQANQSALIWYDTTSSRWRMVGEDLYIIGKKRLALETGVPFRSSDLTAATTIYWTDGSITYSVAVPSTTNTPFDIFYNPATDALEIVNWTNDTSRATNITYADFDGIFVKSGDVSKIYLGTGRTTGVSGQCEDSITKRFLYNEYNQEEKSMQRTDATSHTNTVTSIAYWDSDSGNVCEFVRGNVGIGQEAIFVTILNQLTSSASSTSGQGCVGLGINSIAALSAISYWASAINMRSSNNTVFTPVLGYNYVALLEVGLTGVTFQVAQTSFKLKC